MDWSKEIVWITGGHGFLGQHLVKKLKTLGATILAPYHIHNTLDVDPDYGLDVTSMVNLDWFLKTLLKKPTVVIHLAAQPLVGLANESPLPTWTTNVLGTCNVLEACRLYCPNAKILVAESDKSYGDHKPPYNEYLHYPKASFVYETSKACTGLIAQAYFNTFGMSIATTRCTNFYGPGDMKWNRIVPGTIKALYEGNTPIIRSQTNAVRDYIYVEDAADGYIALAEKLSTARGESFNFSSGIPVATGQMMSYIARAMGKTVVPQIAGNSIQEVSKQYALWQKAKDRLGWAPKTNLSDGLHKTVAWYMEYLKSTSEVST